MSDFKDYGLEENPLDNLKTWFEEALKKEQNPYAMTIATIDHRTNRPLARTVLLKEIDDQGLYFYTNYESIKAQDLDKNPECSILFYWHNSKKQLRIQGRVEKVSKEKSLQYFSSRDRQSQEASFMSKQSSPVKDKAELMDNLKKIQKQFEGQEIPLPESWGGYLFLPYEFEFFLYGDYRINDRFLFLKEKNDWIINRLQP